MRKALKELPKTLDETYDRILLNIPNEYRPDAQIIFTLLAYSSGSVSLIEVAEAVAIDLEEASFDPRNRLPDPCSILKICSSLLTLSPFEPQGFIGKRRVLASDDKWKILRFAHYSVKEYLISQRLSLKNSRLFKLDHDVGHDLIARLCVIYLLSIRDIMLPTDDTLRSLPFLQYAAEEWHVHYLRTQHDENGITRKLALRLFTNPIGSCLQTSLLVSGTVDTENRDYAPPLYYASRFGLFEICQDLLARGDDIDAQGGLSGNALQVAAYFGHESVVRLLIQNGAEINAHGKYRTNALQAAMTAPHEAIVKLLLENGADANSRLEGFYGNVLQQAAAVGHDRIVKLLLRNGADINAQGGKFGNALQAAVYRGRDSTALLLLANGADANAQELGLYGCALRGAVDRGNKKIARALIEAGADVNAEGENILEAAVRSGRESLVRMMLKNGAEAMDMAIGNDDKILEAAVVGGEDAIVELLIERAGYRFIDTPYESD